MMELLLDTPLPYIAARLLPQAHAVLKRPAGHPATLHCCSTAPPGICRAGAVAHLPGIQHSATLKLQWLYVTLPCLFDTSAALCYHPAAATATCRAGAAAQGLAARRPQAPLEPAHRRFAAKHSGFAEVSLGC